MPCWYSPFFTPSLNSYGLCHVQLFVNGRSIKQRTSRVQVLVILALCVFTFGVYGVSREGWHLC